MLSTETQSDSPKPFLKRPYRSELGVFADILNAVMDAGRIGLNVSAISRVANLSHNAVISRCQQLHVAGLVQSMVTKRNRLFKITEKGMWFFGELQKFQVMAAQINVRF